MPPDELRTSMHVVRRNGKVASGGDGVLAMLGAFPRTRPQAWLARSLPPLRRKADREYRKLADRRGELSAKVPDAEVTIVPPRWIRPDPREPGSG